MRKLAVKLDETVGDDFFASLDSQLAGAAAPCSLDEFMALEMSLYQRYCDAGLTVQAGSGSGRPPKSSGCTVSLAG